MSATEEVPSREEAIAHLAELIKDIRIAMLTTVGTDGSLHSRPMATQTTSFEGEVLFLSPEHSGKVNEIKQDAEVNLTYADGKHTFVTMTGRAVISNDRALIQALWSPTYKAWFPDGVSDPEIRVLRIRIDHAEYWDAPDSAVARGARTLMRAASGGKTKFGDHAQLTL